MTASDRAPIVPLAKLEDNIMLDLLMAAIAVGFFAACLAYVAACERL